MGYKLPTYIRICYLSWRFPMLFFFSRFVGSKLSTRIPEKVATISKWVKVAVIDSLVSAFPELLQSGQRQQWRRRRSRGWRLRDPPHHTSQPRRPFSAAPHGARVRLPLPLPASQRPAQHLLLPRAARPHDVQHAGSGHPPPLGAYALSEYTFFFLSVPF